MPIMGKSLKRLFPSVNANPVQPAEGLEEFETAKRVWLFGFCELVASMAVANQRPETLSYRTRGSVDVVPLLLDRFRPEMRPFQNESCEVRVTSEPSLLL